MNNTRSIATPSDRKTGACKDRVPAALGARELGDRIESYEGYSCGTQSAAGKSEVH